MQDRTFQTRQLLLQSSGIWCASIAVAALSGFRLRLLQSESFQPVFNPKRRREQSTAFASKLRLISPQASPIPEILKL